jgi:hypothetical protein
MAADRMLRFLIVPVLAMGLIGCGRKPAPTLNAWASAPRTYVPVPNSSNAFDTYALAAIEAEQLAAKYLDRVSFTPGHKKQISESISKPFEQVIAATAKPCEFQFVAREPFTDHPHAAGWRMIGRVFVWRIDEALAAEDYGAAVRLAAAGTRFGFDLTGGGAVDASLGLAIVDEIRKAIAPHLSNMDAAQLEALAAGMEGALERTASTDELAANELENMRQSIQYVQNSFLKSDYEELSARLGPTVKDAVEYLQGIKKKDVEDHRRYFQGFASEAEETSRAFARRAGIVAKDRTKETEPKLAEMRPWRRFAWHFFGTLEPLLEIRDITLARTRLLIVSAKLKAQAQSGGHPPTLAAFPAKLITDPFSGAPFVYHADKVQFLVYSVGPNLKDDGGETDGAFSSPDLLLEIPD